MTAQTPNEPDDEQLLRLLSQASRARPPRDLDRTWSRLRAATEGTRSTPRLKRLARAGLWAATLVALASGVTFFATRTRPGSDAPAAAASRVYASGPAQTATIQLRDGTRVILAPESRLEVSADFGLKTRDVTVKGQAFFEVVHDAAHPFRVRAKDALTEDIGTRFDIRAYDDEVGIVVIVAEGAVSFGRARGAAGAEGLIVKRGERGRLVGPNAVPTIDHVSLREVGWTEGRLSFVRTPVGEVTRAIGRWYDLDVRISDPSLAGRLVTADFDVQAPQEMLEVLATAIDAKLERNGSVLTFKAKKP